VETNNSQEEGREAKERIDGKKPEERGIRLDSREAGGKVKDERVEELEREIGKLRDSAESQAKRIRETEEKLKRSEELLLARPAELSETQSFLSTKDSLPEAEVLDIVRDLNLTIYQVAVKLTEEWEKLGPSRTTNQRDVDSTSRRSRFNVPALVRLARNQDSGSLTFLLQSRLCYQAAHITSSWGRQRDLAVLESVYERLSASGERRIIDVKQYVTHTS